MDSRRYTGPEDAFSYKSLIQDKEQHRTKRVKTKGEKKYILQTNVLSQSQGSAYVEFGSTKVLCSVFGPREIPRRSDFSMNCVLQCQLTLAPFLKRPPKSMDDHMQHKQPEEKDQSSLIQEALRSTVCLNKYPKSQIDVYITILDDSDGDALACAITCAGLALASASIQMFDLIIGASECDVDKGQTTTVGYLPNLQQIASVTHKGVSNPQEMVDKVDRLIEKCQDTLPLVQQCLISDMESDLKDK